MKEKNNYSIGFENIYKYAYFPIEQSFTNDAFDELLRVIGRDYYKEETGNCNTICRLIQTDINEEWQLNKLRRISKKVSISQIKSIRHSFKKVNKNERYVKIPFNILPIFYFILCQAKSIDSENSKIHILVKKMNDTTIGNYLYEKHIETFESQYDNRMQFISEVKLREKYSTLHAQLLGNESLMRKSFLNNDWANGDAYRIQ